MTKYLLYLFGLVVSVSSIVGIVHDIRLAMHTMKLGLVGTIVYGMTMGDFIVLGVNLTIGLGGVYICHLAKRVEDPQQPEILNHTYHDNADQFSQVGILRRG